MVRPLVLSLFTISCLSVSLSACSWLDSNTETHTAACNKLKSDIVFNAATSNTRRAEIQSSEEPLIQKTYDANCLDR